MTKTVYIYRANGR